MYVVAGVSGHVGSAAARALLTQKAKLKVLVRDAKKGSRVVDAVQRATGNQRVRYALVDLSLAASIRSFAEQFDAPLNVLVNNAAVAPRSRQVTAEGHEREYRALPENTLRIAARSRVDLAKTAKSCSACWLFVADRFNEHQGVLAHAVSSLRRQR